MAREVVTNHAELASAIANSNVDLIVFGADIELIAPISIPVSKTELVFDGMDDDGVIHTFTDIENNTYLQTLSMPSYSSTSVTFRNMNMTGRNFYGIPYVYELGTSGVSVTYENITYVGPQLAFNAHGTTHFVNTDITISPSAVSVAQEVGEVNRVDFAGENIIRHNSASSAVFYFRDPLLGSNLTFTMLPGSKLTVDSTSYFMYNYAYTTSYVIENGASLTINSDHGFSENSNNRVSAFTIENNAAFRYVQANPNNGEDSMYLTGNLTVNEGGSLYMQAAYDDSTSIINITSSTGTFNVNAPKSFVLYKPTSAPLKYSNSTLRDFSITSVDQLNHWTTALDFPEAGGINDTPQSKWHNSITPWAPFSVQGSASSGGNITTFSGLLGQQPPSNNFNLQTARVISAGNMVLNPDTIVDNGRAITGETEPGARLEIEFTVEGEPYKIENITADENGRFTADPNMSIPIGTIVSIKTNTPFLTKWVDATVVAAGEISITYAPETISFNVPPIALNPVLLRRTNPVPLIVEVTDLRVYPTGIWKLWASISGPLTADSGEVLENAVVFRDEDEELWELSETPIVVYTKDAEYGPIDATWNEDRGILVRVTQPIRSGARYTTQLGWALEVIEEP